MAPTPSIPPVNTRAVRQAAPPVRRQIATTLAAMARKAGILDPEVIEHWGEIIGPELEKLCRPVRIKRMKKTETLVVSVSSGAAAMRVQYAEKDILARAASHLGRRGLTRLAIEQTGAAAREPRWKSRSVSAANAAPTVAPLAPETLDDALEQLRHSLQGESS